MRIVPTMPSPQHRTPVGRLLVAGVCSAALVLGPTAGMASASDATLAKTIYERAQQLDKREKSLAKTIKSLQSSPSLSRVRSAQKDAAAFHRTTEAFRDEVRDDDGSTDKGIKTRDDVLPELTKLATAAKSLDRQVTSAVKKKRKPSKAVVTKIVSAKLTLDKQIGKVVTAIGEAFADDGSTDPAPPPKDPTE